jgi:hypothetical protein
VRCQGGARPLPGLDRQAQLVQGAAQLHQPARALQGCTLLRKGRQLGGGARQRHAGARAAQLLLVLRFHPQAVMHVGELAQVEQDGQRLLARGAVERLQPTELLLGHQARVEQRL